MYVQCIVTMSAVVRTLGFQSVYGKEGWVDLEKALHGKYSGLYFAGIWCPPCRDFTVILREFYELFKDKIEIIFISWDYEEEDYIDNYKDMPWLALPYSEREIKDRLCVKYDVIGTPRLVVLREDATVVTFNARKQLLDDHLNFPANWSRGENRTP